MNKKTFYQIGADCNNKSVINKVTKVISYNYKKRPTYESTFCYKVLPEGCSHFKNATKIKTTINHENNIDYVNFHNKIMKTNICVKALNYNSLLDFVSESNNKDSSYEMLNFLCDQLIPITKEEYDSL